MRVGIVTISFNQAKFLQQAIDSVAVTCPYVVVDPGSTDGSREIIERNRDRFARIIFEPDEGPADGLNKGFAACDADVYGYLNADDRFAPGALDYVAEYFMKNPQTDLLLGAIRIIDERGRPSWRGRAPDRMDARKYAAEACFAWQQATFFRRKLFERVGGFNPDNPVTWDGELTLEMVLAGARIGYTNRILGHFRIYEESLTGSDRLSAARKTQYERWSRYVPMRPMRARLERLKYKYNIFRHVRCTFGIRPVRIPDPQWSGRR
jgi:glycosyltransferase involved in cell wall biosynthesis